MDLTQHARDGWNGSFELRPAYDSSPAGMAFLAGMAHRLAGHIIPATANMSRGNSVRIKSYRNVNVVYHIDDLPSFRTLAEGLENRTVPGVMCNTFEPA